MKLEIGTNDFFEVRKVQCKTALANGFTMVYLSDLHFNRNSDGIIAKMIDELTKLEPDIILLGGDYVDFGGQLPKLDQLLNALSARSNVFAIAGNHDYHFDINTIRKRMEQNHIHWLENNSVCISVNGNCIQLDGAKPGKRNAAADFSVLCLHQPVDAGSFHEDYDIAFAGHLHGCQFVFWQLNQKLYPGRFFYKWNLLEHTEHNCKYLVSKGMGDTLPVRVNCSKEMIYVQVQTNQLNNTSL